MKQIPILFSTLMVQAILAGRKTMTRRIVKPQPDEEITDIGIGEFHTTIIDEDGNEQPGPLAFGAMSDCGEYLVKCPYGQPGDIIWVRESWQKVVDFSGGPQNVTFPVIYKADSVEPRRSKWKPSIHMPKDAARIWGLRTGTKIERLNEITDEDALLEGLIYIEKLNGWHWSEDVVFAYETPRSAFKHLFISVYNKPTPIKENGKITHYSAIAYDDDHFECHYEKYNGVFRGKPLVVIINPWVWVVEFKVIDKPKEA